MLLRLAFVALIGMNIVAAAWLLLGQDDSHGRRATDANVPELRLFGEQSSTTAAPTAIPVTPAPPAAWLTPGPAVAATTPPPPTPAASAMTTLPSTASAAKVAPVAPPMMCLTLGPFASEDALRDARHALAADISRSRARQEQVTQSRGWWVHLPTSANHAQALALTRQLAAKQVQDYFIINDGAQVNTVSLGLFKDQGNARKRRDQVVAAGFAAQVSERIEHTPEYWLDLVVTNARHLDWRSHLRDQTIGTHSTSCF